MARHNRVARGLDQRGDSYELSYQPDWLRLVKVTRTLESGRQSTKTLYKNPARREQSPGQRIRTRVAAKEQRLEFEIELNDPQGVVRRIIVETAPSGDATADRLVFSIDGQRPQKRRGS
ncbi:MAG TPA: hypothetical protein VK936_11250 [Longimicrobiales bacterium]|nr:hypothetical protein [Longimicrobiales bacterium]